MTPKYKLVLFKSLSNGEWFNQLFRIRGGQIVQIGGEGYKSRATMLKTLREVYPAIVDKPMTNAPDSPTYKVGEGWEIRF